MKYGEDVGKYVVAKEDLEEGQNILGDLFFHFFYHKTIVFIVFLNVWKGIESILYVVKLLVEAPILSWPIGISNDGSNIIIEFIEE